MAVKELYGPANKVAYDLFYGEESLIYSLYGDLKDTLSFNFKVYKDKNNIYQKLKTNPEDIYFRHHFINRALANANRTFEVADSESYRELMTGDQTADFLQIGKKTFQNWVSDGKIPFTVIGKQRFFKKSELLQDNQNYLQKKS